MGREIVRGELSGADMLREKCPGAHPILEPHTPTCILSVSASVSWRMGGIGRCYYAHDTRTRNRRKNRACPIRYQRLIPEELVPNCMSETGTDFLVSVLAPISGKCVIGIMSMTHVPEIGTENRYQKTGTGFRRV